MKLLDINKFEPSSKKRSYRIRSFGRHVSTPISYQYGKYEGKQAILVYIKNKPCVVKLKQDNKHYNEFKFSAYGGQGVNSANTQRERILTDIVFNLFTKLGWSLEIEPHMDMFRPDLVAKKEHMTLTIELKAYHKSHICGDPEIAQAMKYFEKLSRSEESSEDNIIRDENLKENIKSMLVTTGELIDEEQSIICKFHDDPIDYLKNVYRPLKNSLRSARCIDKITARGIYHRAVKKFEKNIRIGFAPMNLLFFKERHIPEFEDIILNKEHIDIMLMPKEIFHKILLHYNLYREARQFQLLSNTLLERLILNDDFFRFNSEKEDK